MRVFMTIEKRAREQEKSQFSKEELDRLHKLHGINSAYGIGYYIGATEQIDIDYKEANDYMVSLLEIANELWMEKTGKEMFDIETHSLQLRLNMGLEE